MAPRSHAAPTTPPPTSPEPSAAGAEPIDAGLVEVVEIEGRLGAGAPRAATSATGDVLTRADIVEAQPRSVAELLAPLADVNTADETGNGRQLSLELRGFAGSAGATAVTLDGLRINEPDTNVMSWELIRLEDIERIEVQPGPHAALGGGSLAGVVHLSRRRAPSTPTSDVSLSLGSFGLVDVRAFGGAKAGRLRLGASGSFVDDDGFRDDAATHEQAGRLSVGTEVRAVALDFDWSHVEGSWRQPGALTKAEMADDPWDSTHNALDSQDQVQDLLTLRAANEAGDEGSPPRTSWLAIAGFRDKQSTVLTSGRSCYGFSTDDSVQSLSGAFEASTRLDAADRSRLRWGAEVQRDRLHPEGYATDDTCDGEVHAFESSSAMDLDWNRVGIFAGFESNLPAAFVLEAGIRHDISDVARIGQEVSIDTGLLEPTGGQASFAGTQGSLGLAREVVRGHGQTTFRARWEQSSLAPSATQLFAYPGYFSNPGLVTQVGQGPTLGVLFSHPSWSALAELFQVAVDDEIVYNEAALQNMNAGSTRRRGAHARFALAPHPKVHLSLDVVMTEATFLTGWGSDPSMMKGQDVPLVPRHDATLDVRLGPWHETTLRLALRSIGEAPLTDDFDGSSDSLPAHEVLDLSTRSVLPGRARLELAVSLTNALDERYATRGIEAAGGPYYTPAPPRAVTFTISHRH